MVCRNGLNVVMSIYRRNRYFDIGHGTNYHRRENRATSFVFFKGNEYYVMPILRNLRHFLCLSFGLILKRCK